MTSNQVLFGNCIDSMQGMDAASTDLVFADPPFNIGLDYSAYDDNLPYDEYVKFSRDWLSECHRILKPTGSIYVAIGDEFAAEVKVTMRQLGFKFRNWVVWNYSFGESQRKKFNRTHAHILYMVKDAKNFTFNASDIMVPSARQLIYKDKRAKSGGKLPDDVWDVFVRDAVCRADQLKIYPEDTLLWDDSRLCGTFKERLVKEDGSAHPCQLPMSILERVIKVSSNPGDLVVDPFCGTGTTAYVANRLKRSYITMEMDPEYVDLARRRIAGEFDRK